MKISKEALVSDMEKIYETIGKIPSRIDYAKYGEYSKGVYQRRWGSWNKALIEIFGKVKTKTGIPLHEVICPICRNPFMQKTSSQKFCSRNCSAKNSNTVSPKRKKQKLCPDCKEPILSSKRYCDKCVLKRKEGRNKVYSETTLSKLEYKKGTNRYGVIRQNAQWIMRDLLKICSICGYDKHAEICHRRPIKDFAKDTKISEINDPTNLVLLCPNCHWELDHGIIKMVGGDGIEPST